MTLINALPARFHGVHRNATPQVCALTFACVTLMGTGESGVSETSLRSAAIKPVQTFSFLSRKKTIIPPSVSANDDIYRLGLKLSGCSLYCMASFRSWGDLYACLPHRNHKHSDQAFLLDKSHSTSANVLKSNWNTDFMYHSAPTGVLISYSHQIKQKTVPKPHRVNGSHVM